MEFRVISEKEKEVDKTVTLAFLIKNNQIILANKKKGFGKGFLNGYGGGLEKGETVFSCLIRELSEECGVIPTSIKLVANIDFYKLSEKLCHCIVFFVMDWRGKPKETEEMGFPEEFFVDALPFHKMWHGDKVLLPLLLSGMKISRGHLVYSGDMKKVELFNARFY